MRIGVGPLVGLILGVVLLPSIAQGRCQIPCGIYDDRARIERMLEDANTIEKSMTMIGELAGGTTAQEANQLTRWIMNKEDHASNVISDRRRSTSSPRSSSRWSQAKRGTRTT